MIPRGIALRTSKEKVPEIVINLIIPILSTSSVDAQHQHYSSCIKEINQTKSIHNYYYYYVLNFILIFTRQKYKKHHVFEVRNSLKEQSTIKSQTSTNTSAIAYIENLKNPYVKIILACKICNKEQVSKQANNFMKGTKDLSVSNSIMNLFI